MRYIKTIGTVSLIVLGILLSPLLAVLILVVIFLGIIYALVSHLWDIPKKKKRFAELQNLTKKYTSKGIYAYLWYDRNSPLTESIENKFLPKYRDNLIFNYGNEYYGSSLDEEATQLSTLLTEFFDLGDTSRSKEHDAEDAAVLYLLKPTNDGEYIKWDEVAKEESDNPYDVDVDATMKRFDEKMQKAAGGRSKSEIKKKYRGTILGIRNYESDKGDLFVKDLSDKDALTDFMFEVADTESDFTPAGLDFIKEYYDLQSLAKELRKEKRSLPPHGGGRTEEERIKYFLDFVSKIQPMANSAFINEDYIDQGFSIFYFYFPYEKKSSAERLGKFLHDTDGFDSDIHIVDKDVNPKREWTLEIYKKIEIDDLSEIHKIDDGFEKLAERFGGSYDGHEIPA